MSNPHIYDCIILGTGYGGIGMGAQLTKDGTENYLILEAADEVGGVWRDNTYPGAACDTQALIYCYSYFLNLGVSRMFAGQVEIAGIFKSHGRRVQSLRAHQVQPPHHPLRVAGGYEGVGDRNRYR